MIPGLRRPPPKDPLARLEALEARLASALALVPVRVGDPIRLTGQNATIAATAFATAPTPGFYIIAGLVQCTTADAAAGNVTLTLRWADDAGASAIATGALTLAALGRDVILARPLRIASGNVTYETAVAGGAGTSFYAIDCALYRLPTST